jgi:hypothetical protein
MAVEAFGVRNFHAAKDEFASRDELMNIVSDADVNHAGRLRRRARVESYFAEQGVRGSFGFLILLLFLILISGLGRLRKRL